MADGARLSGNARRDPPWQDPHAGLGPPGPYPRSQRGRPCGLPPGAAGRFGNSVFGLVPEPGGTPGVMSAVFVSVPGAAFGLTRTLRWKLTRWPGRRRGITRQRRRPMRRSLRLALTNLVRRGMRSQTWTLRSLRPAVTGGDRVAREAAGAHRALVGLLVDHVVATWWTRAVTRSETHVVEQVAITGEGKGPRHAGAELQAVDGRGVYCGSGVVPAPERCGSSSPTS